MTVEEAWRRRANSFGHGVEEYDQTRPGYTAASVRWVLGENPKDVLDLGAGTGLLTKVLREVGHRVFAVEPDDAMRRRIRVTAPGAEALAGNAESIPLGDGSVDAVLVSHAYHWFEPEAAHAEMARVLRPGGVLACLWNLRDEEIPWSARLSEILADEDNGTDRDTAAAIMLHGALRALRTNDERWLAGWLRDPGFGSEFGEIERGFFPHSETKTAESLVSLVKSRSYYLTSTVQRQRELVDQVRQLVANHPDLAGRREFELPYVTVVFKATRR